MFRRWVINDRIFILGWTVPLTWKVRQRLNGQTSNSQFIHKSLLRSIESMNLMNLLDFVWVWLSCRVSVCGIGNYVPNYYPSHHFTMLKWNDLPHASLSPLSTLSLYSQHSLLQVIIVKYDEAWICPHEISIRIDLCDCKRFFSESEG